jgi:hypothetical protein
VELLSTSPDKSMTDAIAYLIAHRKSRQDRLPIREEGPVRKPLRLSISRSSASRGGPLWYWT